MLTKVPVDRMPRLPEGELSSEQAKKLLRDYQVLEVDWEDVPWELRYAVERDLYRRAQMRQERRRLAEIEARQAHERVADHNGKVFARQAAERERFRKLHELPRERAQALLDQGWEQMRAAQAELAQQWAQSCHREPGRR